MKTKPFDLQAAMNGAQVVTRDGYPARIVCFDYKGYSEEKQIVAIAETDDGHDEILVNYASGSYYDGKESKFDLLMLTDEVGNLITPQDDGKKSCWRKIKDGLPPMLSIGVSKEVVVRSDKGIKTVASLKKSRNGTTNWKTDDKSFDLETISAWCPIPDYDRLEYTF